MCTHCCLNPYFLYTFWQTCDWLGYFRLCLVGCSWVHNAMPPTCTHLEWHIMLCFNMSVLNITLVQPSDIVNSESAMGITWQFWCVNWVSEWLIYLHLGGSAFWCLITHLSWSHSLGVNANALPLWTRVWGLSLFWPSSWRLSLVLIPSWLTPSKHQNWVHPLMRLIPCFLQSLQGSYAWLVPLLIILNCSLFLCIKSGKLWCQARALPLPIPPIGKMSAF